MRTVAKALKILDLFSDQSPLLGLSEIARITDLDRATCYRMLKVLGQHGYVSKSPATKKYTLGATVLRLARAREIISPASAMLQAVLTELTHTTQETSHASLIAGHQVATVVACDGLRNNRVHVEHGGRMELHATATGLACLAFADGDFVRQGLEGELAAFTRATITSRADLERVLEEIRKQGYSIAERSFDNDVVGIGAPIFGADEVAIGALAVATPASRIDAKTAAVTARAVVAAALAATGNMAGRVPSSYLRAIAPLLELPAGTARPSGSRPAAPA